ncbi:MAG: hypothetical protein RLY31_1297 [Bacteroidota bacterium]|jgi:serine/threonine protein kinase
MIVGVHNLFRTTSLLPALALFLASGACLGQQIPAGHPAYNDWVEREQQRFLAMTRRDTASLMRMLDPALCYIHSNGLAETRGEHLSNIAEGAIVYESIEPSDIRITRKGRTVVLRGQLMVSGRYKGTPFSLGLRYLDVYIRRNGKWRLLAWQSQSIR